MKKSVKNQTGKVISYRRFYSARYPNAAAPGYLFQKLMDWALAAAISLGTVTTLFFMFTLG